MPGVGLQRPRRRWNAGALAGAWLGIFLIGFALLRWFPGGLAGTAVPTSGGGMPVVAALLGGSLILAAALLTRRRGANAAMPDRDPVTGLYLERHADDLMLRVMARDDRAGQSAIVLVVVSIDGLDGLVGRYGAGVIDGVLGLVGSQIRSQVRDSDFPLRLSGGRLGVFLHCDSTEQALAFGRRISMLLAAQQLNWRGDQIKPTLSMGVAARANGESLAALKARAETMRVRAEGRGGGRIEA